MDIIKSTTSERDYPFNKANDLIPVKNGVIKIDSVTGKVTLLEHSPLYRFDWQLPIVYDPNANPDAIMAYLQSLGCDVDLLLQIPAHAILSMGGSIYKKCYLLKGEKNSGKTVFLKMLNTKFFGRSICANIPLQDLINEKHMTSGIVGKVVNISDDLPSIKLDDVGQFKALTGGGDITINRKYCHPFSYECRTLFVFASNSYPPISKDESAFWERWILIPFNESFPIDPTIEERTFTDDNMSALLNLVIKRIFDIKKAGVKSDSWERTRALWLNGSDPFFRYINTQLERDIEAYVPCDNLYKHYQKECKKSDIVPITKKEFGSRIQRIDVNKRQKTIKGKKTWCYFGYKIKTSQLQLN